METFCAAVEGSDRQTNKTNQPETIQHQKTNNTNKLINGC